MKKLILVLSLVTIGLSGCYAVPYHSHDDGYRDDKNHHDDRDHKNDHDDNRGGEHSD